MKALVLEDKEKLVMKDVPKPIPKSDELLIKTKASTICTSDIIDIQHNPFGIEFPMIIGHEGAGIVVAMGDEVTEFKLGDEITAHPVIACGECESCLRGLSHLCDCMEHLGLNHGGTFAEYFTIRKDRVRKKPDNMSFPQATLMEPMCVCIEAVKRANVQPGHRVLVIGDGPFGIMISNICSTINDTQVILLGRHEFRMNHAKNAIKVNGNAYPDVYKKIMEITDGKGVDSAVLCVGTNVALDTAVECLRSRGTLSIFSGIHGKASIDMFRVQVKELNLCGSCNDMDYLDDALLSLSNGDADGIITHEFPFDEYQTAFRMATYSKSDALKITLCF